MVDEETDVNNQCPEDFVNTPRLVLFCTWVTNWMIALRFLLLSSLFVNPIRVE